MRAYVANCLLSFSLLGCGISDAENLSVTRQSDKTSLSLTASEDLADIGFNSTARMEDGVAITEGVLRVRRRHENDMDFAKYNPFYWQGRLTHFRIEDHTPKGIPKISFHLMTEWPQDYTGARGPDFSAIYIGNPIAPVEHERSKFAINARMEHIADYRHFAYTVDERWFQSFPQDLKLGKLLTMEARFFNSESFPLWQEQWQHNPHNLSAYYSEFLRIQIGKPGLLIDDFTSAKNMPARKRYSGGWTTTPTVRVEPWKALQQQAFNLSLDNAQDFLDGRTWFHTDMITGEHREDDSDDKPSVFFAEMEDLRRGYAGSVYQMSSCNSCHLHNGISLLPAPGEQNHAIVARTFDRRSGSSHPAFGKQLQNNGAAREGDLLLSGYEEKTVRLDDGTEVRLRKPIFQVENARHPIDQLGLSIRKPPALIGMGLLAAIPDESLRELARQSTGRLREIDDKLGRFGWKAEQTSLREQIASALHADMGVLSADFPELDCSGTCSAGKGELPEQALQQLESYMALLAVPPRNFPHEPKVERGEKIFLELACQSCHVPEIRTGRSPFPELSEQTIHPYTDLLLHDMGEGLADESGSEWSRLWRTAPLWGLKNVKHATNSHRERFRPGNVQIIFTETQRVASENEIHLLHDGRALSLMEAILWHGGDAEESVRRYKALSQQERDDLEAFLWDL